MKRSIFHPFALALTLAACGSDSTALDDGDLSASEVDALNAAVVNLAFTYALSVLADGLPAAGPARSIPFSESFNSSGPCPLGGSVLFGWSFSGDLELGSGAYSAAFDFSMTPEECALLVPTADLLITIDGTPNLDFDLDMAIDGAGAGEYSGSYTGGLAWRANGRTGSCRMDISFSGRFSIGGGVSEEASGTACGQTISGSG
jgi:hypothetical protein